MMRRINNGVAAALLAALACSCSVQDSTQPPENSISADPKVTAPVVKAKKRPREAAPRTRTP
jgi:hypothetical protein